MRSIFYAGLVSAVAFSVAAELSPREYDGIVAVVNEDIITAQDLEERVRLMLFSIGEENSSRLTSQIKQEALKEMIQERLKWQCAKKFAPRGGWVSEREVNAAFAEIAERNKLSHDNFCSLLKKKKINESVLLQQIRISLSWVAYVNARFGRFVNISESEMKKTLSQIKERENLESYYVYRMFFPVSDVKNEAAVSSQVNNIMQLLKKGADFRGLARQLSKSPDANKGGEIGWVFPGQLSAEENSELQRMPAGSFGVVRNSRGYVILFLRNKKEAGMQKFTVIKFVQVVVPFREPNPGKDEVKVIVDYLGEIKRKSKSCHDFINRVKDSGFCAISPPSVIALEEVQPEFRSALAPLPIGGTGNPIVTPNGVVVICMLDRKIEKIPEPTPDDIMAQKTNERLSVFADRELQDLYKKSTVKIGEKYGVASDHSQ